MTFFEILLYLLTVMCVVYWQRSCFGDSQRILKLVLLPEIKLFRTLCIFFIALCHFDVTDLFQTHILRFSP